MSVVHDAFPEEDNYFTEQMVVSRPERNEPFPVSKWIEKVIVGALSNWNRNALLRNLAADKNACPHTGNGGCPFCFGAFTVQGDDIQRNPAYYVAAHASKSVPPGSYRVDSGSALAILPHVAFQTPTGGHVLIVSNTTLSPVAFNIRSAGREARTSLQPGSAATYVW